jgi:hypothetical protein
MDALRPVTTRSVVEARRLELARMVRVMGSDPPTFKVNRQLSWTYRDKGNLRAYFW